MSEEQQAQDTQLEPEITDKESQEATWEESQNNPHLQHYDAQVYHKDKGSLESSVFHEDQEDHYPDPSEGPQSLDLRFVLDIPLQVTVELGRKRLLIQDLLKLNEGAVIELTKQVSEPLDVLVNQKLIARGEVVVVNDKFGVRITDIISPEKRLQQIQ